MATAPGRQAGQFYRRVSARLDQGTYQAPADGDPIAAWAQHHRSNFTGEIPEMSPVVLLPDFAMPERS
ncbi:MAG TPA: hypothetical protein VMI73_30300 [Trebonia sp.]|nr:hypothetical protein [Trebonia sp.]